jgi:outer membrane protein TolC
LPQLDLANRVGATSENLSPGAPGLTGGIIPSVLDVPYSFAQTELQIQWTLHDFGRTGGRYRQAVSQERIAMLRYLRAQETVAYDVAVAYTQGLLASAVRVIQQEAIRSAEAVLKDTQSRRAAGVADRDDVLRAEVQLSESREALVLAEEAEWAALARLNNVMGRNAALPLRLVDPPAQPPLQLSLVQCLEIAAAQRPEVGVAQQSVASAQFGRQAAAGDFYPRVYVRGSLGFVAGENVEAGFQKGTALHLDTPLYHGGGRQGNLRAADAEVMEAVANAETILDNITLEVTLAHLSAVAALKRIDLSRPAVAEARENLRLVGVKYRNGDATPTDIVDAETTLTRAQQRYYSATYGFLAALARLDYATGSPQGSMIEMTTKAEELGPPRPIPAAP